MINKKYIFSNWKMNKNFTEAKFFMEQLSKYQFSDDISLIFYVNYLLLEPLNKLIKDLSLPVVIGSQNFYYENSGAYTGEISYRMLQDIKINNTLIAHSERRKLFLEDNILIKKKILTAIENNFSFTLCVGESIDEKRKGISEEVIIEQLMVLKNESINFDKLKNISIAYEPVWAIGTGESADVSYVKEKANLIFKVLENIFPNKDVNKIPVLYGGSVNSKNIMDFISIENINGCLIGNSSLEINTFTTILDLF